MLYLFEYAKNIEMKRIFYTLSCCLLVVVTYGQVTIMDNTPVNEELAIERYDSLSNFRFMLNEINSDYFHLKGQTIIYCGWPYWEQNKEAFKVGDSFFIKDIVHQELTFGGLFVLQNTNTKTIYKKGLGTNANQCWVVKGHIEKLRKLYVGNEYLYIGTNNTNKTDCLISLANHQPNREVKKHSVWKCIDIQVKPRNANDDMRQDSRSPVVIVFENPEYGKYYCYYESMGGIPRNHMNIEVPPLFEMKTMSIENINYGNDERIGMRSGTFADKYGDYDSVGSSFINGRSCIEWYYGDTCVIISSGVVIEIRQK